MKNQEPEMTADETWTLPQWPRTLEEAEGRVLYALTNYQIIEMALKVYLSKHAKNSTGLTDLPKKRSGKTRTKKEIKDMALGELTREFESCNTNTDLHQTLRAIRGERNEIAHQALVVQKPSMAKILGVEPMTIQRLRQIDRDAMKAMTDMVCELIGTPPRNKAD